jgi:hypothetical protein
VVGGLGEGSGALLRAGDGLLRRGGVCLFGDGSGAGATEGMAGIRQQQKPCTTSQY